MKKTVTTTLSIALLATTFLTSCDKKETKIPAKVSKDMVFNTTISEVRLGDGVPLNIDVSVRWKIQDFEAFSSQFDSPESYDSLVLATRESEIANKVANQYMNVDSVFTSQRHQFINQVKGTFASQLGESGIEIKEVIVSNLKFPENYTNAMEQLAMQEQELERIRKQSLIDLEVSMAAKKQAEEDGKVTMAKAEMNAKVQKINAETEKSIRQNRLAP
ncbi:MAG TPA: hypothetical protein DCX14_13910 [Flavobacteriales bacterium]|nr:hypothetical protein [Flavobacteriales bacterium]